MFLNGEGDQLKASFGDNSRYDLDKKRQPTHMSDTIQSVLWALGQKCPLKPTADWENPATVIRALSEARTYSSVRKQEERGTGIFGNVCVCYATPVLPGAMPEGKSPRYGYPYDGFVLSSQYSSIGGFLALDRFCGNCPANGDPGGIGGCVGSFHLPLSSEEQQQLNRLIDRLGLGSKLDLYFPQIRLEWLRFWINSPIPAEVADTLLQLLKAVVDENRQKSKARYESWREAQLRAFVRILERSIATNIPLSVSVTPPGHADMGWHTVFPHCPRCKAEAPVKRWKRKYPDAEIVCAICGAHYSPAKTHSATQDQSHDSRLRELLSQVEYELLAVRCLKVQGASEAEASEIVQKQEELERIRQEKIARNAEIARKHRRFIEKVIYLGLNNLHSRDDDSSDWLFSPEDTAEIIRRCESCRGEVLYIWHQSESGEHDESVHAPWPTSASKSLKELHENGCRDKFSVALKIPQDMVCRWADETGDKEA